MAWIEVHQSLFTHRKTMTLATELGIPDLHAAAHVVAIWSWSLDNAPSGDVSGVTPAMLARVAQYHGEPEPFLEALVTSGFFDRADDRLTLHDWWEYAGKLIERRRADAERKRESRRRPPSPDAPDTGATYKEDSRQMSEGRPQDVRGPSVRTVQYSTVPNPTNPTEPEQTVARARAHTRLSAPETFEHLGLDEKTRDEITEVVTILHRNLDGEAIEAIAEQITRFPEVDPIRVAQDYWGYLTGPRCARAPTVRFWERFANQMSMQSGQPKFLRPPKRDICILPFDRITGKVIAS